MLDCISTMTILPVANVVAFFVMFPFIYVQCKRRKGTQEQERKDTVQKEEAKIIKPKQPPPGARPAVVNCTSVPASSDDPAGAAAEDGSKRGGRVLRADDEASTQREEKVNFRDGKFLKESLTRMKKSRQPDTSQDPTSQSPTKRVSQQEEESRQPEDKTGRDEEEGKQCRKHKDTGSPAPRRGADASDEHGVSPGASSPHKRHSKRSKRRDKSKKSKKKKKKKSPKIDDDKPKTTDFDEKPPNRSQEQLQQKEKEKEEEYQPIVLPESGAPPGWNSKNPDASTPTAKKDQDVSSPGAVKPALVEEASSVKDDGVKAEKNVPVTPTKRAESAPRPNERSSDKRSPIVPVSPTLSKSPVPKLSPTSPVASTPKNDDPPIRKPIIFPLGPKELRISQGERARRGAYPTFDDVKSDWTDNEEKKEKNRIEMPSRLETNLESERQPADEIHTAREKIEEKQVKLPVAKVPLSPTKPVVPAPNKPLQTPAKAPPPAKPPTPTNLNKNPIALKK